MTKRKITAEPRRVFVVFEGGGAKGIAHIGALAALETAPIDFRGFAGTSAGAIVAALASVGYKSHEIFDCTSGRTVLRHIDRRGLRGRKKSEPPLPARGPKDLFGRSAWMSLLLVRRLARDWQLSWSAYGILLITFLAVAHTISTALFWWLFSIWLAPLVFVGVLAWRGFASLDGLVDGMQQALAGKLSIDPATPVTFELMRKKGCRPLRVVASNVSTQAATVFSADTTPEVIVAEAVAASACIPLVFSPRKIGEHSYYDGGLVSNLPAWVFDEERALDADAATVALEIVDPESRDARPVSGLTAIGSAAKTVLFGSSALEKRAVGNLTAIELKSGVGLLDFDMRAATAMDEIVQARDNCELDLVSRLIRRPIIMNELCDQIAATALQMINGIRAIEGLGPRRKRPRVAIAMAPVGSYRSLQLAYHSGFFDDPDAGITLPIESSFVGTAWQRNQSYYSDVDDPAWHRLLKRPEDKSVRRMISKNIVWSFTTVYAPAAQPEKRIVVAVDGRQQIGVSTNLRDKILFVSLGAYIQKVLDDGLPEGFYDDAF